MATYTVEIRTLVENHFDLGLKNYPIFDETYREGLNNKIINHFYFREIGFETAGLFKFYLNQKMSEIMPYYNQLYKSELLKFNPFYNVDKATTNDGIKNGNSSRVGNSNTTGTSNFENNADNSNIKTDNSMSVNENGSSTKNSASETGNNSNTDLNNTKKVHSDTPQGLLSINNIENEIYASDADYNTDVKNNISTHYNASANEAIQTGNGVTNSSNNSSETNLAHNKGNNSNNITVDNIDNTINNSTESYLSHVIGKEGSETYSEMLLKYRNTFINIDMMIIDELNELFMNVY